MPNLIRLFFADFTNNTINGWLHEHDWQNGARNAHFDPSCHPKKQRLFKPVKFARSRSIADRSQHTKARSQGVDTEALGSFVQCIDAPT